MGHDITQLLTDMRVEVKWSHQATMPIPLYERMKRAIQHYDLLLARVQPLVVRDWAADVRAGADHCYELSTLLILLEELGESPIP